MDTLLQPQNVEKLIEEAATRLIASRPKRKRWTQLVCDEVLAKNKGVFDLTRDSEGRKVWTFTNPTIGSGMVTQRFIRVKNSLPIPGGTPSDLRDDLILEDSISEHRQPHCAYCKTECPSDYTFGRNCRKCGAQDIDVEQLITTFFDGPFKGFDATPRDLNAVVEEEVKVHTVYIYEDEE